MKTRIKIFLISFFLILAVFFVNNYQKINQDLLTKFLSVKNINSFFGIVSPTPISIVTPTPSVIFNFYPVIKVVDGDTIDVNIDDQIKRVRVIGINTPELVDPRKTVECFGRQASEKAKSILLGKKVRLEEDSTQGNTDKYGRLLRYVFLEDGTDFGLLMIKEGYAFEYTYNFPYKYQQQYKDAQKQAEENKRGLWGEKVCFISPTFIDNNKFVCECNKKCSQISSCQEAYFQLNNCGCLSRDGDGDGVPCENLCQ